MSPNRSAGSMSLLSGLALAVVLSLCAATAHAIFIYSDQGTEGLGAFEAELVYAPSSDNEAELTVALSNVTSPEAGGYITAFALNNPGQRITSAAALDFPAGWRVLEGSDPADGVKASPFGYFDFGASISSDFLGGGSPLAGIPASPELTRHEFRFQLHGQDLLSLTEESFVSERSLPKGKSGVGFFATRFKGFANGGSDKTLAGADSGNPGGVE